MISQNKFPFSTIFVLGILLAVVAAPGFDIQAQEILSIAPETVNDNRGPSTIHFPLVFAPNVIPEGTSFVPAGEFLMGSYDTYAKEREKPVHIVFLYDYWISTTHVTNAQFSQFVGDTGYVTTAENKGWSLAFNGIGFDERPGTFWRAPKGPGSDITGLDDYPVLHVSWYDAKAYCEWAGGRMPTEAEWEKAARGPDGNRIFPWPGTELTGDKANFCDEANCPAAWAVTGQDDGFPMSSPAGFFPAGASPYGVLDMAGNVTDWVHDWYGEFFYQVSPYRDPTGPITGEFRVHRGASWYSGLTNQRSSARNYNLPVHTHDHGGFRCVFFQ